MAERPTPYDANMVAGSIAALMALLTFRAAWSACRLPPALGHGCFPASPRFTVAAPMVIAMTFHIAIELGVHGVFEGGFGPSENSNRPVMVGIAPGAACRECATRSTRTAPHPGGHTWPA